MERATNVVILGAGNLLGGDEGVGVHALVALRKGYDFPQTVRWLDSATSTLDLVRELGEADELIVLDAVVTGSEPASLVVLEGAAVSAAFNARLLPHQVGIADLLATLEILSRLPKRLVLLGVEPAVLGLDLALSPRVAARVPELCAQVQAELATLGLALTRRRRLTRAGTS